MNDPRLRPRRGGLVLGCLLLLAAILRLGYWNERREAPDFDHPVVDAEWHHWWAEGWATGDWTTPRGAEGPGLGQRSYLRPPGYPAFLSLVYRVFGVSISAAVLIQFGLGLVRVLLVHELARAACGLSAARVAAGITACWWTFIYFEAELHSPALLDVLVLATWCVVATGARIGVRRALAAGLLGGAALLVRPDSIALVAAAGVFAVLRANSARTRVRVALAGALAAGLCLLPSTARNHDVSGRFVPVSSNLAVNLYLGNHADAEGTCGSELPGFGRFATCWDWPAVLRRMGGSRGPVTDEEAATQLLDATVRDVTADPLEWLVLVWKKARMFWGWREIGHNKELALDREDCPWLWAPSPFPVLAVLAGFSGVLAWRRRRDADGRLRLALTVGVLATFVVAMLFFVSARHRAPVLPLLCVLASGGLVELWRIARSDVSRLGPPILMMMLALVAVSLPPAGVPPSRAKWHWRHGQLLSEQGETAAAKRHFDAALVLDPDHGPSLTSRALQMLDEGHPDALRRCIEAAQQSPGEPFAHYAAGMALFRAGSLESARVHLERAAREGNTARFDHALGMVHLALGDLESAAGCFSQALQRDDSSVAAMTGLGIVHASQERDELAEPLLRRSLNLRPDQPNARRFLDQILERKR